MLRHTFGPVARSDARVLILGSMPGEASLRAGQYYAHPKNKFWSIMETVCGAGPALGYPERLRRLEEHRIALWDVVSECVRPGSLDGSIVPASVKPNDFAGLFRRCPAITTVLFNGQAAAKLFQRHVKCSPSLAFVTLPSTSPAHASLSLRQKTAIWRDAMVAALG